MAHFYGTIKGSCGKASRLGTKASGLHTVTASWHGAVSVYLWYDADSSQDMVRVSLMPWRGQGMDHLLYVGPVSGAKVSELAHA